MADQSAQSSAGRTRQMFGHTRLILWQPHLNLDQLMIEKRLGGSLHHPIGNPQLPDLYDRLEGMCLGAQLLALLWGKGKGSHGRAVWKNRRQGARGEITEVPGWAATAAIACPTRPIKLPGRSEVL